MREGTEGEKMEANGMKEEYRDRRGGEWAGSEEVRVRTGEERKSRSGDVEEGKEKEESK